MYVHNHGYDNCGNKWRWHTSIFKQKPTRISCVKRSKINVTQLSRRSNTTLAFVSSPCSFEFLRSLHCWKVAPIFTRFKPLAWSQPFFLMFCFSDIFLFLIYHLSLSIVDLLISILCIQIEHSLLSVITRHPPYYWLATSVFLDSVRRCFYQL